MNSESQPQPSGYPWWQWILAVLTFWPLFPMLVATLIPSTRAALMPRRIWAGYGLILLVSIIILFIVAAIVGGFETTQTTKSAVPTQLPATLIPTALPPTRVVQTGLNVSRDQMQEPLRNRNYNAFTYDQPRFRDDGTPFVMGKSSEGDALMSLIGPADNLDEVQYMFMVSNRAGGIAFVEHTTNMIQLLQLAVPAWPKPSEWIYHNTEQLLDGAFPDDKVSYRREYRRISMSLSRTTGLFVLTVKSERGL